MISDAVIAQMLGEFEEAGKAHALAISDASTLEHMRPIIRARLANQSHEKSNAKANDWAMAQASYEKACRDLSLALEKQALTKYEVERQRYRIELFRTRESSRRTEMKHIG